MYLATYQTFLCERAYVCVCMLGGGGGACVRACVRVCVCVCACVRACVASVILSRSALAHSSLQYHSIVSLHIATRRHPHQLSHRVTTTSDASGFPFSMQYAVLLLGRLYRAACRLIVSTADNRHPNQTVPLCPPIYCVNHTISMQIAPLSTSGW